MTIHRWYLTRANGLDGGIVYTAKCLICGEERPEHFPPVDGCPGRSTAIPAAARRFMGYFADIDQETPVYDPGPDAPCPICDQGLAGHDVRTICMTWATNRDLSVFYRVHQACHNRLSREENGALDGRMLDLLGRRGCRKGGRVVMERCQECQTYGSDANRLVEIAVDDGEGIYECEHCMGMDMEYWHVEASAGILRALPEAPTRAGEGMSHLVFGETQPIARSGYKARHQAMLDQGLHPMTGKPLRAEGGTCGQCVHRRQLQYAKRYGKCELAAKLTHGPATDCKARWPACALFEVRP